MPKRTNWLNFGENWVKDKVKVNKKDKNTSSVITSELYVITNVFTVDSHRIGCLLTEVRHTASQVVYWLYKESPLHWYTRSYIRKITSSRRLAFSVYIYFYIAVVLYCLLCFDKYIICEWHKPVKTDLHVSIVHLVSTGYTLFVNKMFPNFYA